MHVRPRHSVCRACQQIVSYTCTFTSCWFQHFRKYGCMVRETTGVRLLCSTLTEYHDCSVLTVQNGSTLHARYSASSRPDMRLYTLWYKPILAHVRIKALRSAPVVRATLHACHSTYVFRQRENTICSLCDTMQSRRLLDVVAVYLVELYPSIKVGGYRIHWPMHLTPSQALWSSRSGLQRASLH